MTFKVSQLEEMTHWCDTGDELADVRQAVRRTLFGEDGSTPVDYWPGAGDHDSRQRRFLGWFMFSLTLDDGRRPTQIAA